jgi:SAM-dependent methyltransferase
MEQLKNIRGFSEIVEEKAEELSGNEKGFFLRVWKTDAEVYINRLKAIGFSGLGAVLDAGCGYGQWSIHLAAINKQVHCIDFDPNRINILSAIAEQVKADNLKAMVGSIEAIEFPDNTFDAVFSYSVLLMTDYKKAVKEFLRVLKPNGKLYICSNGLGWYLHNILTGHNSSTDFDARQMGIETIENTFDYLATGVKRPGTQIVIPGRQLRKELENNGFTVISLNGDGEFTVDNTIQPHSFFQGTYLSAEGVYELIAEKNKE